MRVRTFRYLLVVLAMLGLSAVFAVGQAIDGNIVGTVVDGSGAAIVGADITATNIETNVTVSAKSGGTGDYRFDHLLVGTYRITVKMPAFKAISELVQIELNKTVTRNMTLRLAPPQRRSKSPASRPSSIPRQPSCKIPIRPSNSKICQCFRW